MQKSVVYSRRLEDIRWIWDRFRQNHEKKGRPEGRPGRSRKEVAYWMLQPPSRVMYWPVVYSLTGF
ncbi:MAG: hypothetical protein Q3963_06290, partial [Coriobacteriaceae bacterium]|nr:hypothetical protein [Coriobacteriaceae bacterium]